ncbi:YecA family protein [Rhodoferax sp. U11-2br]|uniref:YecA family protein n=1 Tax=Rhodoferax sp. U11-2br TaxID=2838878 RepID=UPI001BECA980|nr:SEC-C metal-binding domain-containing protein [Rhodoferax sp. U11-2br]MBT3068394.1 SEC-C domain-containing protein [Rhodoferax sp. U11-2br]
MLVLKSPAGLQLLSEIRDGVRSHLLSIDAEAGVEESNRIKLLLSKLADARIAHESSPDEVHDDIFVLETYVKLVGEYGLLWRQLATSQFSESWSTLQNAFGLIRLIKRFSGINVSAIEDQLCALETAYPYNIFFSMGAVVERFECSICGKDIDSFDCSHRKGELYRGQMAHGIARNILRLDHLAIVEQPVDKRCTVTYANDAPQFEVVRYLGRLLSSRKLLASNFGGIAWGKRASPKHQSLGRNDPCHCGSGLKYKKCCIDKPPPQQDHAQILPTHSILERVAAGA